MIADIDICRAAKSLVDRYGEGATERAERRASELRDDGEAEGAVVWRQILGAVEELTRARRDGKPVN
jgi:hypothetical protein